MAISVLQTFAADGLMAGRSDRYPILPDSGQCLLQMVKKRRFSMDELNPDRLQNPAIVDMMRHPPLDESGFGLKSL
jgi:hypothetical protein